MTELVNPFAKPLRTDPEAVRAAREAERARLVAAGIDPDGTIAEADAGFVWGFGAPCCSLSRPSAVDLRVVDLSNIRDGTAEPGDVRFWATGQFKTGACSPNWLRDGLHYPGGVFHTLWQGGVLPRDEKVLPVVREFAKIRECGWARTMLVTPPCCLFPIEEGDEPWL